MKHYQPKTRRAVFAIAAFAMTTLSMATLVAAPAQFGKPGPSKSSGSTLAVQSAAPGVAPAAKHVTINPSNIEVVAFRVPYVPAVQARNSVAAKPKG